MVENNTEVKKVKYKASPTLARFHRSEAFVRGCIGPIGSGKSVAMCWEILRVAKTVQQPSSDGRRYSRWAIVRNTYAELRDTTIKTWLDWFGHIGVMKWTEHTFVIDNEDMHVEVLFRALDRPNDAKKLLSLELSGAWINEAREIQLEIVHALTGRLGRYPSKRDNVGCSYPCLIMDTNPPSDDSWWYQIFEEQKPVGYEIFKQPSGISEEAENIENLPDGYYTTMMAGKPEDWLKVYRDGEYGFLMDGKAVWPEYSEQIHLLDEYTPDRNREILIGMDFGRTPVAVLGQKDAHGRWIIFDELQTWDMGATRFSELLHQKLVTEYPGFRVRGWGDPAGDDMGQNDDNTPMQIVRKAGIRIVKGVTQDTFVRVESVRVPLTRIYEGKPAFMLTPKCKMLRKALAGGYHYKRVQVSGTARYEQKPNKNEYSHVSDALQYLMSSGGEAVSLVTKTTVPREPITISPDWNVI